MPTRWRTAVGRVDPRLTSETEQGLEAVGVLDMATVLGRRVYELVKQGTLSWSIGFTIPPGGRRKAGKIVELTEIDLAEVSVVATPANADARTLSIKSEQPIRVVSFPCRRWAYSRSPAASRASSAVAYTCPRWISSPSIV
jgi:HK97 family phage prohead protease